MGGECCEQATSEKYRFGSIVVAWPPTAYCILLYKQLLSSDLLEENHENLRKTKPEKKTHQTLPGGCLFGCFSFPAIK